MQTESLQPSPEGTQAWRDRLWRAAINGAAALTFLLAILPAAQAHDDDALSPAQAFWGISACLFMMAWLALACYRVVRPGRSHYIQIRLGRLLPRWLSQRLYWVAPAVPWRLPRYRAHQGGRAALRRRR